MEICPVCRSRNSKDVFSIENVPVDICVQWENQKDALNCRKGRIDLVLCFECGFIWNRSFDPEKTDYSLSYENSLFYSPLFENYTSKLINRLISKYDIRKKTVLDIGCGKGDFLRMFCEAGSNHGIGFDTSFDEKRQGEFPDTIKIIKDKFSSKYSGFKADMVCSRYVFEHVPQPRDFLFTIKDSLNGGEHTIYFEVPNVQSLINSESLWDIIYEHCSYFGRSSLGKVFEDCGFSILDIYEGFEGQFLSIEAKADSSGEGKKRYEEGFSVDETAEYFSEGMKIIEGWREWKVQAGSKKTVLWGAGAKGVNFLNIIGVDDEIEFVIDINPYKQGKFTTGTGHEIKPVSFLKEYKPDVVVLCNPVYKHEIRRDLNKMGLEPELVFIGKDRG